MKVLLLIILALFSLIVVYFVFLSATDKAPDAGLVAGKLRPCPDKPNCVSSDVDAASPAYIEPIKLPPNIQSVEELLQRVIVASGGKIQRMESGFLWATYTSTLFRFTDDVEIRWEDQSPLYMRSASRVGHSDLGVNRKRVELIRELIRAENN